MLDHVTLQVAVCSHVLKELRILLPGGSRWMESGERKKQSAQDLLQVFPMFGEGCGRRAAAWMLGRGCACAGSP